MNLATLQTRLDDFLQEKVVPLPRQQKVLIAVALLVLPVVAFYFLFYADKAERLDRLTGQQIALRQEIDKLRAKQRQLPKLEAELKEAEARFQAISVLLPKEKEIPSLLTNISALGTSTGLDFLSFRPKGERAQDFYAEIPVEIKVRGQYHNIGLFFAKVSKLPRIVTISGIAMGNPKRRGNEVILETSFSLITYRFLEEKKDGGKKKS